MTEMEVVKKLAEMNSTTEETYGSMVDSLVRRRYSISQELAILRKRDSDPEAFAAYDAYCEECKAEARAALGL